MSDLILGWQVTSNLEPRYWLGKAPKPGGQPESDLFKIAPSGLGAHMAIIAQSGSGKSFFLGRLLEEIALRTRARCLILDPNADFGKLHDVESEKLWADAAYDVQSRLGKLPHEPDRKTFESQWSDISVVVRVGSGTDSEPYEQIRLSWPAVSTDFLGEDLGPVQRSELYHCHLFVKTVHTLVALKSRPNTKTDYLKKAETLLSQALSSPGDFVNSMKEEFSSESAHKYLAANAPLLFPMLNVIEITKDMLQLLLDQRIEQAVTAARYVSDDVRRYYFGRVNEFRSARIVDTSIGKLSPAKQTESRIEVIDLPSFPSPATKLLAINATIASEWERARAAWGTALAKPADKDERIPTFLVVDEAHNLVPFETRSKAEYALREQFRTIVAEGRKYGLFLILVSQRPDKLDPLVVSECENRAIMKLSSASTLETTRRMLALEDVPASVLAKCLEMPLGRALLVGPWSPHRPEFLYSGARRTVEGGRNLRASHWGVEATKPAKSKEN